MRLHSGAFFFAQGSLVSFRLALNVFVQGFFFCVLIRHTAINQ